MKDSKYIDQLLEKYFDGQTSLKEEQTLRDYFSGKEIYPEHKIYTPIFAFFNEERKLIKPKKRKINLYYRIGAVACIALLLTVGLKFQNKENDANKSIIYIDGKKISDKQIISKHALTSVTNITSIDEESIEAQLSVLDMFNIK